MQSFTTKEKQEEIRFRIEFFEQILQREPKYIEVLEKLGHLYTITGEFDLGLKVDRKIVRLQPDNPTAHYNLACSLALKRRFTDAIRTLQRAVECGYDDWTWIREDPDLEALRKRPAFSAWLASVSS